ncbi:hypothetical protein [Azospirillum canadense]|uniref:hypothetical protein n=1 Tax=Azospirillum canadense TaxID=403962 RepID=UPI002227DC1F|nr:hypothetical protein [Azospirillum canadense]MCW2243445.1 dihydroneopterin aldolase [Azospirillum canadense]
MANHTDSRRADAACDATMTYTILLRDFTATVSLAGRPDRTTARINLELKVSHPGRDFPDDIAAVMSYEDIVEDLRRLCAEDAVPGPDYLADRAAVLCLAHAKVRRVRVDVELSSALPDMTGSGVSITREQAT